MKGHRKGLTGEIVKKTWTRDSPKEPLDFGEPNMFFSQKIMK